MGLICAARHETAPLRAWDALHSYLCAEFGDSATRSSLTQTMFWLILPIVPACRPYHTA